MAPQTAPRRAAVVDHRGRPVADDPRLSADAVSGRTSLTTMTGSPLAQFLEALADAWAAPQILSVYDTVPAAMFEPEYCAEIERRVRISAWDVIAQENLMPLAVPSIRWTWLPQHHGSHELSPSAAAKVVGLSPDGDISPGTSLPEHSCAVCIGEVAFVGLPAAERRPGPRHTGLRHSILPAAAT